MDFKSPGKHSESSVSSISSLDLPAFGSPLTLPQIPDHLLLRRIGRGSYGEVWLARNATGSYRAIKIVHRSSFDSERPYEREFNGLKKFEPISHARESQVDIFHVGRNDSEGFFYYIMELADSAESESEKGRRGEGDKSPIAPFPPFSPARQGMRSLHVGQTTQNSLQAIQHLQRAVESDPNFADAWAQLAGAWNSAAGTTNQQANVLMAAEKAVSQNPNSGLANSMLASAKFQRARLGARGRSKIALHRTGAGVE